tara:strand:- start:2819 stop:3160 length:342 start_codon:yes stop_codon:yes gene_type:complete
MKFYEHTIIAKQDLSAKDLETVKNKYEEVINSSDGKVLKTENWGLLNFAKKIKNYNKGHFIHYKFQGENNTLDEIKKTIKIDMSILRSLVVNYKKLNMDIEYFRKDIKNEEKK